MIDTLLQKTDRTIAAEWKSRPDRSRFVRSISESRACKQILNVGSGGKRELAKIVDATTAVFDLDMAGDCDLKLNLDSIEALPFADGEFEMVCAMDVLEHLESFHRINDELFRVSSKCVLISLPNSAVEFLQVALRRRESDPGNERGFFSKYYGLPLKRPPDRHRWWLYPQDIVRFYETFACTRGCKVTYFIPATGFSRWLVRLMLGKHLYYTFLMPHIAILLEKRV
jgi:Methyltransferase domain